MPYAAAIAAVAALLVVAILVVAGSTPPPDLVVVVPAGTAARLQAGEAVDVLAETTTVPAGARLILRNEDQVAHQVGPFWVGAGQTYTLQFPNPGRYNYTCSVHQSGQVVFVVEPGWFPPPFLGILAAHPGRPVLAYGLIALGSVAVYGGKIGRRLLGVAVLLLGLGVIILPAMVPSSTANPFATTPLVLAAGREGFDDNCAICHGRDARGTGPLASTFRARPADLLPHAGIHTDAEYFRLIADGTHGGTMPDFSSRLTADELWKIVAYLQSLGR